jgi:hypothetical protein
MSSTMWPLAEYCTIPRRRSEFDAEHALTREPRSDVSIGLAPTVLAAAHIGATMDVDHDGRTIARRRLVYIENRGSIP